MKITKKKKKQKKYISLALLILLLVVFVLYGFYVLNKDEESSSQKDGIASTEKTSKKSSGLSNQQDIAKSSGDEKADTAKSDPNVDANANPANIPTSQVASVSITNLEQRDGSVSYSAQVEGFSTGLCSASFTSKLGRTVAKTTQINNNTCSQSINEMEFDALGEWTLTLRVYHENTQAIAERNVTIQ